MYGEVLYSIVSVRLIKIFLEHHVCLELTSTITFILSQLKTCHALNLIISNKTDKTIVS